MKREICVTDTRILPLRRLRFTDAFHRFLVVQHGRYTELGTELVETIGFSDYPDLGDLMG